MQSTPIIQKPKLNWRRSLTPLNLSKVDAIALHHMAHPTAGIQEIERWHLQRDNGTWNGFGYNYWIGFDGQIYEGRGLNQAAGVYAQNSHILSIGFQGDYQSHNKIMPDAQYNTGIWAIEWLKAKVPTIKTVDGHKRWNSTSCPGQYFPLAEMIAGKARKGKEGVTVRVNGKELKMDVRPYIEDGRAMVPVRFIAEALGAKVEWDGATKTVNIQK